MRPVQPLEARVSQGSPSFPPALPNSGYEAHPLQSPPCPLSMATSHHPSLVWTYQASSQWVPFCPPQLEGHTPPPRTPRHCPHSSPSPGKAQASALLLCTPNRRAQRLPPNPYLLIFSDFSGASVEGPAHLEASDLVPASAPQGSGTQAQSPPLPSFQDAVTSGAMTQRPCAPTGPVGCPHRCAGSWPTTATGGVSAAAARAPSPPACSSSGSPSPRLPAPCGSGSAPVQGPGRDHLQPLQPPGSRPAPPSRPPSPPSRPPRHLPWPAAARPHALQLAPSWSPAGPPPPAPCLPQRPVAPSPTVLVLTQPSRGLCPRCLSTCPGLWALGLPSSLCSLSGRVLARDPGPPGSRLCFTCCFTCPKLPGQVCPGASSWASGWVPAQAVSLC